MKFNPYTNMLKSISLALLLVMMGNTGWAMSKHPSKNQHDGAPRVNPHVNFAAIPNATPKPEARSRYGNPPHYEVFGRVYNVMKSSSGYRARGVASWYGTKFHGKRASIGEPYNMYAMTAAHKTLPLPTYVRVTNLQNGRHIIVRVNDRGPFVDNRLIDLSYAAAIKLGIMAKGTGLVEVDAIDPMHPGNTPQPNLPLHYKPKVYLQLGAFSSESNASRMAAKVHALIPQRVNIIRNHDLRPTLFRVQIGPMAGVKLSDAIHNKLAKAGFGDAITVVR